MQSTLSTPLRSRPQSITFRSPSSKHRKSRDNPLSDNEISTIAGIDSSFFDALQPVFSDHTISILTNLLLTLKSILYNLNEDDEVGLESARHTYSQIEEIILAHDDSLSDLKHIINRAESLEAELDEEILFES
ncbi:hypothetical protein GEMRC1_012792 [Eukaryota sp. GEM-RC1]